MPVRLTRRELLAAGAAGGAGLALSGFGPGVLRALAAAPVCGSLKDIEHVVILIQENRSFDHYFGTYRGVRGFADPNVLQSGGEPIWYQSDGGHNTGYGPPSGFLAPIHLDSFNNMGECTNDISHEWALQHKAWNGGAMDSFLKAHLDDTSNAVNAPMTMGYYTRKDMAYYYALADAFTLCDAYHCSVIGPTDSNRLMSMTATIDPAGANGGPWLQTLTANRAQYLWTLTWPTYPEQLQANNVSWKVYSTADGHYGDNVLAYFKNFNPTTNPTLAANAFTPTFFGNGTPGQFEADCAAGTLPQVSWVLAPLADSEHPPAPPVWGEATVAQVLNALTGNPALWAKTALFVTFDENGGFFDHVPPPTPPPGTAGEYITATGVDLTASPHDAGGILGPVGLGFRVPLLVCSPFTRGGFVCHDTFDHTSLLLFLEQRFGVEVPNISAWRRATVGNLTSALNVAAVDTSVPTIAQPSYADSRTLPPSDCAANAPDTFSNGFPTVTPYTVPQPNPALPTQESGTAPAPSGLSCSPGSPVPTGSPLMLVASALGAAGAVAAAARIRDALHSSETEHL
ncbi:MAG: phospholipase [Candidatus Dormibacteraeota bacterium]|nr:phospholipase [Candidatus Dormibacteraeota bacterium]MBV9526044.1 phospholipase [Candidatus Dormibacteraeota bacterium]